MKNVIFVASIVLYRLLLDFIYIKFISPSYFYMGFQLNFNKQLYIVSWIVLLLYLRLIINYIFKDTASSIILLTLFLLRFVPFTSFFSCNEQPLNFIVAEVLFWLMFFLFLFITRFNVPKLKSNPTIVSIAAITICISVVLVSWLYTDFRFHFSLMDVYDIREEARDFEMPRVLYYLWASANNVLPLFVIYYWIQNKKIVVFIISVIILLNFGIDGAKTVVFKFLFCILLYAIYKPGIIKYLAWLLIILCFISILENKIFDTEIMAGMIHRRVFYIPAILDSHYFDYYTLHGTVPTSDSEIDFEIGDLYFNKDGMRANNGLFSDAIIHGGYLGLILYPFLYGVLFKLCDYISVNKNPAIIFFMAFLTAFTFNGSAINSSLFSHGIAILIMIVYIMPRLSKVGR